MGDWKKERKKRCRGKAYSGTHSAVKEEGMKKI